MTTINTIVKATPSTLIVSVKTQEARTFEINNPLKGVVGQLAKLGDLIEKATSHEDTILIEAGKIPGIFKAFRENSKDLLDFKLRFVEEYSWELLNEDVITMSSDKKDVVIFRGDYSPEDFEFGETQLEEVVEMETPKFNFKDLPFKEASNINCLLQVVGGKTFPESLGDIEDSILKVSWNEDEKVQLALRELESIVKGLYPTKEVVNNYPLVVYTGPVVLPTVIQLGVVYSEVGVETDQGVKTSKFLYTNTGIITCKGTKFESVGTLINAVKAAFKVEAPVASETTQLQPEESVMKTFVELMKEVWIPSKDTWIAQTLINKMRTTWTSGKYPTDENQKLFMKAFVAQVDVLPQGVEMPARAFLTAYDMVVEQLTGAKPEVPEFKSSMTGEDAASSFEGEHKAGIVTQTITKVFKPVALPEHLKKCEVKDLPKPEARSYREILLDKAVESVKKLTEDTWDMQDSLNLESICETFDGGEQYQVHVDIIRMWIQESTKESETLLKQTQEESSEDEELSEGKVTIKTMLGATYTIEVLYNNSKTLWINTRSGESFTSLYDLCMVHDKEYLNHSFFVNGQLVGGK